MLQDMFPLIGLVVDRVQVLISVTYSYVTLARCWVSLHKPEGGLTNSTPM